MVVSLPRGPPELCSGPLQGQKLFAGPSPLYVPENAREGANPWQHEEIPP